jgi:hypothetical protein
MGDQPIARPLLTYRKTKTQKNTQIYHATTGFEPTTPLFKRTKTVIPYNA